MTNTIPNVPRELTIERDVFGAMHIKLGDFDFIQIQYQHPYTDNASTKALAERIAALLSAPSPAGVDGLEVVGYVSQDDIKWKGDCTLRLKPYNDYTIPLCRLSAAHAIIDGLLGENEALQAQVKVLQSDANSWQSGYDEGRRMGGKHCSLTIDQQDHRIGELEGLLRDSAELIKHGVFEDGYCCCGSSIDSHGLGDGHSPVDALAYHAWQVCERIDAALPAGKDSD